MKPKVEVISGPGKPDLTLEPFFRGQEEARLVQLLQSPIHRRAMRVWFDRHGCLHCRRKDVPHAAHLLCHNCDTNLRRDLKRIEREIRDEMQR